jgi:UMF1 family MFS transporter
LTNESDDNPNAHVAVRERTLRDKLSTPSWILYDFSDTIFSASILTFFFPLWVTQDAGGTDALFAFSLSLSALLVAVTAPMSGAVSDRMNRRVPMLAVCVLLCTVCTGLIGAFGGLSVGIALFFFANFLYQTGLVFYNSLIRNVSSESGRGIVSGIGVGAGYVGLFVSFILLGPIVEEHGNRWAFIPTAALYVLFALPLLIIVKDVGRRRSITVSLIGESYRQLFTTLRNARRHKNLFRFIAARFLYMEAINTVSSFYVIYLVSVNAFTEDEARDMVVRLLMVAVVSSIIAGFLVSRYGSKKVLTVALVGWTTVVVAAALVNATWMFWVVGAVTGCFWGAPQIADRVMLTRLAPEGQLGEFFGLFQMSGRLSAVIGPALWGLTTTTLIGLGEWRYRVAMLLVSLFLIGGLALLLAVREEREPPDLLTSDEQPTASKVVD